MDETKARILRDIETVGWSVMGVFDPAGHQPAYAYTIGLQRWGWPELLCIGLDPRQAGAVLNNAVRELRDRRVDPSRGMRLSAVLAGYCCRLAPAPGAGDRIGLARWFAGHDGSDPALVDAMQLHWPDKAGRLPGDVGCAAAVVGLQALPA